MATVWQHLPSHLVLQEPGDGNLSGRVRPHSTAGVEPASKLKRRSIHGPKQVPRSSREVFSGLSKRARQHGNTFGNFRKMAFFAIFPQIPWAIARGNGQIWPKTNRHLKSCKVEEEGDTIIRVRQASPKTQFPRRYIGKFSL